MSATTLTDVFTPFEFQNREQRSRQSRNAKVCRLFSAFVLGMLVATIALLVVQHHILDDASFAKFFFARAMPRVQPVPSASGTSVGVQVPNKQAWNPFVPAHIRTGHAQMQNPEPSEPPAGFVSSKSSGFGFIDKAAIDAKSAAKAAAEKLVAYKVPAATAVAAKKAAVDKPAEGDEESVTPASKLYSLKLRVAKAKQSDNPEELQAAEEALTEFEMSHVEVSLADAKGLQVMETLAHVPEGAVEALRLKQDAEDAKRLDDAEATLAAAAREAGNRTGGWVWRTQEGNAYFWTGRSWRLLSESNSGGVSVGSGTDTSTPGSATSSSHNITWRQVVGAIAQLGYLVRRGSLRAELSLLRQLTERAGTWVAREADMTLRKVWGTSVLTKVNFEMDGARNALVAGDAVAAMAKYDRVVCELATDWPEAWHRRGLCLQRALGRHDDAAASYEVALTLNPRHYPTMLLLGQLLLRSASFNNFSAEEAAVLRFSGDEARQQAIKLFEEAVRLNPLLRAEVDAALERTTVHATS